MARGRELTEALETALIDAHSVERAVFESGWPRRVLDAVDKPVVALKLAIGVDGGVRGRDWAYWLKHFDESERALKLVKVLELARMKIVRACKGDSCIGERDGDALLAASALDEAVEALCREFGYDYSDLLDRVGDFEDLEEDA